MDGIIIRHNDINLLNSISKFSSVPVINALTKVNHPCEILSDLYSFSKITPHFLNLKYLYIGANTNIGYTWKEATMTFGIHLTQCCPAKYFMGDILYESDIRQAITNTDILLTDTIPPEFLNDFKNYQITKKLLDISKKKILFDPCPPFYRGEEVSDDAIQSNYFVGYEFKKNLLKVQAAIIYYCLNKI